MEYNRRGKPDDWVTPHATDRNGKSKTRDSHPVDLYKTLVTVTQLLWGRL